MTTLAISRRNQALKELYCHNWTALCGIASRYQNLSKPYLAWIHPDYEQADIRLVVVGKETNGWGGEDQIVGLTPEDAVAVMMKRYQEFQLGVDYSGKAAFWTPVHELYRRLNPHGSTFGFVALNASKMDQDQKTPNADVREAMVSTELFREELRILEPHVVVFFTGPNYESWLDGCFPDLKRTGDKWLSRLDAMGFRSTASAHITRNT
jgi:hypothetical protein